jgi:nucleoside-triphosphatase THEP1
LLKQLLHRWLQKEKTRSQQEIKEVLELLPATQQLIVQSWKNSAHLKGVRRLSFCSKIIFVNTFSLLSLRREAGAEVYILTAPIQSGKTTSLINWSANRNDVYGILTPVVNGKRVFMNVNTKERFPMEAKEGEREILTVGRFAFSKNNFERAIQIIRDDISKNGWLIIDEIGPLELAGQGFHDVLLETLRSFNGKLLLVVRDKDETVERVKSLLGNRKVIIFRDLNHPEFA